MVSVPRGAFVGEMSAAGIGKFRKSCAGGAGTLSEQFSLRVLGHNVPTSPFLFFGSAKPFLLFRREREEMVSVVSSPPQRRNSPVLPGNSKSTSSVSLAADSFLSRGSLCDSGAPPRGRRAKKLLQTGAGAAIMQAAPRGDAGTASQERQPINDPGPPCRPKYAPQRLRGSRR